MQVFYIFFTNYFAISKKSCTFAPQFKNNTLKVMQNKYENELSALCKKYLKVITDACDSQPNKVLVFGNIQIKTMRNMFGEQVPYIFDSWTNQKWLELYSADAYSNVSDIAHWADVCEDVVNSRKAGNTQYSVLWNVKH